MSRVLLAVSCYETKSQNRITRSKVNCSLFSHFVTLHFRALPIYSGSFITLKLTSVDVGHLSLHKKGKGHF